MATLSATPVQERLCGIVQGLTFHSPESGFFVARVKLQGHDDEQQVVGNAAVINVGEQISATGTWQRSSYGPQFKAIEVKLTPPTMLEGIETYLANSIKGIGAGYATKLVGAFGEDVFAVIEHWPERLNDVKGIGKKRATSIVEAYKLQAAIRGIMVFLHQHGLGRAGAKKVYDRLGDKAEEKIRQNPFILCKEVWGIGFLTADTVAKRLGVPHDSDYRVRAGIEHVVNEAVGNGSCGLPVDDVLTQAAELLGVSVVRVAAGIELEINAKELVRDTATGKMCLFPPKIYESEKRIARMLLEHAKLPVAWPLTEVDAAVIHAELEMSITLEGGQRAAVYQALESQVCVITGGPGTGKTTLTNVIVHVLQGAGMTLALCAPTGKAAKRLTEATGFEAKTIHRTLEVDSKGEFQRNEENPLDVDALVIDEMSMADVPLFVRTLKAMAPQTRLILLGDVDQLPSVGPGKVLADIINSEALPVARLTEVFRQAKESAIIRNAHRVNQGLLPEAGYEVGADFAFLDHFQKDDTEALAEEVLRITRDLYKKGFDPIRDVQVLAPMKRGQLGVETLNQRLREVLNPDCAHKVEHYHRVYGEGDKVMQLKNNYDKEVFNGDIGFITEIDDKAKMVTVEFDERKVLYRWAELGELTVAYAITVHKSQGSEFPVVVMPLHTSHYMMLKRNLLYTGITRARQLCIVLGVRWAAQMAVENDQIEERYSKLRDWLAAGAA